MGVVNLTNSLAVDAAYQSASFAFDRQRIFSDNIANIDTPGFKTRDLDASKFNAALSRAIERSKQNNGNEGRLELPSPGDDKFGANDLRALVFHDDNNRTVEQLMTGMLENAILQSQTLGLVRTQNNLLRAIISEQVSR